MDECRYNFFYCFVQKAHLIGKQNVYVCCLHVLGLSTKIYVAGGGGSVWAGACCRQHIQSLEL